MKTAEKERKMKTSAAKQVKSPALQELFFIISPQPHIKSDVSVLKDDVHYLIGRTYESHKSLAHISLFQYENANPELIDDLIEFVESKARYFESFNVFLKDFGTFHHGAKRTIYMDIVNKYPIRDIFEKLVKEDAHFTPHITIAKNLTEEEYLRCMPYLRGLKYGNQHFVCDRITILARQGNKWAHYKDIMFGE
jgi:2'-5' RNA ligase